MPAMTNAQRQARFRERHYKGDLLPPISAYLNQDRYVTVKVFAMDGSVLKTVELLPCPFCSGSPKVLVYASSLSGQKRLYCDGCTCSFSGSLDLDVYVHSWNKRVQI